MSHEPIFADDRAAFVWPAWLFSATVHAAALTMAAIAGGEAFHGANSPPQQPVAWNLELSLADASEPAAEDDAEAEFEPSELPPVEIAAIETPPIEVAVDPTEAPALAMTEPEPLESPTDEPAPVEPPPEPQPSVLGLDKLLAERAQLAAARGKAPGSSDHFRVGQLAGRATVRVFGVEGTGSKFVYLFDRSTSMAGAPLAAAQQQLLGSLDALSSVHQFHVIFFNHRIDAWSGADGGGRIAFATDRNKRLAAEFVRRVTASGGTYRLDALHKALRMAPDVIFFLTDADDTMPAAEVADAIANAARTGTTIACIEFGNGPPTGRQNFLTELAQGAGGQYGYVDIQRLGR